MKKQKFANSNQERGIINKRNAFTLIELLAIIVILAIIAVITVPIILNIIEDSKKGSVQDSAYGYKDAVEKNYVSNLLDDSSSKLNGTYIISDGEFNGDEINLSGSKPTKGYLIYENNKLTSGCLEFDGYRSMYSGDKFNSAEKGECEITILYYTYDPTAEEGPNGKITTKETEIDSSWTYYIKETTRAGISSYTLEGTMDGQTMQEGSFETLSECESKLNTFPQEQIETMNIRCVELNTKTTNEVCGVENGTTFCLKPNDYANSVNTLNTIFPGCNADASNDRYSCLGSSVSGFAYADGTVEMAYEYGGCYVGSGGVFTHCSN